MKNNLVQLATENYNEGFKITPPRRAREKDNGLDVAVQESFEIAPFEHKRIKAGIKFELSKDMGLIIMPRSSTLKKNKLMVETNLIDESYNGQEISIQMINLSNETVSIDKGHYLGQVVLLKTGKFNNEISEGFLLDIGERAMGDAHGSSGDY